MGPHTLGWVHSASWVAMCDSQRRDDAFVCLRFPVTPVIQPWQGTPDQSAILSRSANGGRVTRVGLRLCARALLQGTTQRSRVPRENIQCNVSGVCLRGWELARNTGAPYYSLVGSFLPNRLFDRPRVDTPERVSVKHLVRSGKPDFFARGPMC